MHVRADQCKRPYVGWPWDQTQGKGFDIDGEPLFGQDENHIDDVTDMLDDVGDESDATMDYANTGIGT
jgi:hypothetical protein